MADDITLTVRVRDATRRPLAELSQRLRRMERDLHSRSGQSNMFDRAGQSLQRFQSRLGTSNAFVGRFRRGLNNVTSGAINPLRRAMDGLGNATRTVFRAGERSVAGLRNGLNSAYGPLTRLVAGFLRLGRSMNNMLNANQRWKMIIIATLVLVGAAAQALGALLVTALGGAFIALGAYALRGSAQVKSAFKDLKSTVSSSVTDAAQPMETFLVSGIQQVTAAVKQMQPALTAAFAAAGPLISDFFGAFTNFASSALPGFIKTLQSSQSTMAGFNNAMGQIGEGIGDMFSAMTENGGGEALGKVWETLGREISNLLVGVGQFINTSAKSGTATMLLVGIFRSFSGVLNVVSVALSAIDAVFGGLFQNINNNLIGLDSLTGGAANLGTAFVAAGQDVGTLKKQLAEANKEIKRIQEARDDMSGVVGPAKDAVLKDDKATGDDLKSAQEKRKALLEAIETAETGAAAATQTHAASVKDLISKIQELNELNLANLDSRAAQEQAIDDAGSGYKKYTDALKMTNGELDVTTQSGRDAKDLLSKIASSTNAATKAAQDAHKPWQTVQGIWKTGREALIRFADGMGLTKEQATILADQILNMPDAKLSLRAETKQAASDLKAFIAKVQASPGSKSVTLKTLSSRAEGILEGFGYKVEHLPDGSVRVTAVTGTAVSNIEYIKSLLGALDGTSATTYIESVNTTVYRTKGSVHDVVGGATGGMASSLKKFAVGGSISGGVLDGPGTKTSDSIYARLSRGEFVMRAAAVDKYGPGFMQAINSGGFRPRGFAKGGKVSKSEKSARSDAASDLSVSFFGKIAGFKKDEFLHALGLPESLSALVGDLNKWRSVIKKATHGLTEKRLLNQLTASGKQLITYEKRLTTTNKALEKAKEKLDDLKDSASSLKASVSSGVLTSTDITQVASDDNNVTMSDIMAQMRDSVDKSSAFSKALTDLKAKGVSKNVIQQIAEAGISGGGLETAGALLGASSSEIKTLNEMQGKINSAAKSAGNTAADAMYGAGIKAAEGLVKGLKKKKKSIEATMMSIAKSMEKAIKKALGIHSPSRVMQKVGDYTAEGFAVGVKKNQRVDDAWSSMLTTPSAASSTGTASASSGDGQYVFPIYIGGKQIDEVILDVNRRVVRTRGGNVQKVFGK